MKPYETMIQDRLEAIQTGPDEALKNRVLAGAISGTAPSPSFGSRRIGMRTLLVVIAVVVLSASATFAAYGEQIGEQIRIILNQVTVRNGGVITNSDYNPSISTEAETEILPYAVKWPSYLPEGVNVTNARFHESNTSKVFYVAFNDRPDGTFDLFLQVTFESNDDHARITGAADSEVTLGKDKVKVYVTTKVPVTAGETSFNMIRMNWFDNGNFYSLAGIFDLETMTKITESMIDGEAIYPEITVDAETVIVETPPPDVTDSVPYTAIDGVEALSYAVKWPTYLPEGLKWQSARAVIDKKSQNVNSVTASYFDVSGEAPYPNVFIQINGVGVISKLFAPSESQITLSRGNIKVYVATGVAFGQSIVNIIQWFEDGIFYTVRGNFDVATLTAIAESFE